MQGQALNSSFNNEQLLKLANHKAYTQKTVRLQIPHRQPFHDQFSQDLGIVDDSKSAKVAAFLRDINPIIGKGSEKIITVKLGLDITNVSDFTWPAGLSFKLTGPATNLASK